MAGNPATALAPGQVVDVRRYGRATVVHRVEDKASKFHGLYLIRYHATDLEYHCRGSKLRPIKPNTKRIVVCKTTKQYRACAVNNVEVNDVVLEVGCHVGVCMGQLQRHLCPEKGGYVVGIDTDPVALKEAHERFPGCTMVMADGTDIPKVKSLSPTGSFTKILIDIGGIRELPTVMHMVGLYYREFPGAQVIIKSVHLTTMLPEVEQFVWDPANSWPAGGDGGGGDDGEGAGEGEGVRATGGAAG